MLVVGHIREYDSTSMKTINCCIQFNCVIVNLSHKETSNDTLHF